jgi:23S rRNA (pseudouridine1915-N3)-methyltransferase
MRLMVIAVGRLKDGPERELAARYAKRFDDLSRRIGVRGLELHEIPESKAKDAASRIAAEAVAIAALIPDRATVVALDERGKALDSLAFSSELRRRRDAAAPALVFLIGGADGLSPELRRTAALNLSFGAATWPHQLVRVMLLEQLYRAATILSGHPYHRA